MKLITALLTLIFLTTLSTAYNYFQGAFKLGEPCFDTFDHKKCRCPLEDVFNPPNKVLASNKPATKLYLFTGINKNKAEQIHQCAGGLPPRSKFNTGCPTEIFIHGYADALCFSAWMRRQKEYSCQNFHIVGSSYGSVAASYAGKSLQDPSCRLGRITALDVPIPSFLHAPESERLNPGDAIFVDVIHTNVGPCFPNNFGDARPAGHVDMYLNDGTHQYSCIPYAFISLLKMDILYGLLTLLSPPVCSHAQSVQYYKTSITAEKDLSYIIGVRCDSYENFKSGKCERDCSKLDSCAPLGLDLINYVNTTDSQRRIYQVPTSMNCPYNDYAGFKGLPLQPLKFELPV